MLSLLTMAPIISTSRPMNIQREKRNVGLGTDDVHEYTFPSAASVDDGAGGRNEGCAWK